MKWRSAMLLALLWAMLFTFMPMPRGGLLARSTVSAANASIAASPSTASPGEVVSVSGNNFQPGEFVSIGMDLQPMTNVAVMANSVLPTTNITVPVGATEGNHTVYALGLTSHQTAFTTVTVRRLHATIHLNASTYDVQREACVLGNGFGAGETVLITIEGTYVTSGQADASGAIDICFAMPDTIVSGSNALAAAGLTSFASASTTFTGVLPLAHTYYFAGGSTIGTNATFMPVFNYGSLRTRMVLTYYTRRSVLKRQTVTLQPHSRTSLPVGKTVGPGNVFGIKVETDKPVVAQLVVYRGDKAPYTTPGASALSKTWYFPEGNTQHTFHEFMHILNPGTHDAVVAVQVVPLGTEKPRTALYPIQAGRIATFEMNRVYAQRVIAAVVTSNQPVFVVREMSFGPKEYGDNADAGIAKTQRNWDFPYASVSNGTRTSLAIYNPSKNQRATLTVNMYTDTGTTLFLHTERIAPQQRSTIDLNSILFGVVPLTGTLDFSMAISSSLPLALERSIYFGDPDTKRIGSSVVSGSSGAAFTWEFPTGDTAGGAHEYLSVFNPSALTAELTASFFVATGHQAQYDLAVPPRGRTTVDVGAAIPELPPSNHSVGIVTTNLVPVVVEQGIYTPYYTAGFATIKPIN